MKRLKALWNRLPKLPRKWKTIRNLLLAVLMLPLVLALLDWPPLTPTAAYRKLEKQLLLTPSEIVYRDIGTNQSLFLTEGAGWVTAGKVYKLDSGGSFLRNYITYVKHYLPKKDGQPIVVALPGPVGEEDALVIAVSGLPEGTASGGLELDLFDIPLPFFSAGMTLAPKDETFTAQAEMQENGWMFFSIIPHDHGASQMCALEAVWRDLIFWDTLDQYPYRLYLYDEQGNKLYSISGQLPEEQTFRNY